MSCKESYSLPNILLTQEISIKPFSQGPFHPSVLFGCFHPIKHRRCNPNALKEWYSTVKAVTETKYLLVRSVVIFSSSWTYFIDKCREWNIFSFKGYIQNLQYLVKNLVLSQTFYWHGKLVLSRSLQALFISAFPLVTYIPSNSEDENR